MCKLLVLRIQVWIDHQDIEAYCKLILRGPIIQRFINVRSLRR